MAWPSPSGGSAVRCRGRATSARRAGRTGFHQSGLRTPQASCWASPRGARPPPFRSGSSLLAWCLVLSGSRSLRVVVGAIASSLGAVAVTRRSRRRCLRRRAGAPGAGLVVPLRSRRRDDRPPLFRGGGSLSARCVVLSGSRSLCVVVGAVASSMGTVAVGRRSRSRCLRCRAGAPGAGLVLPPRSRRRCAGAPGIGAAVPLLWQLRCA